MDIVKALLRTFATAFPVGSVVGGEERSSDSSGESTLQFWHRVVMCCVIVVHIIVGNNIIVGCVLLNVVDLARSLADGRDAATKK